MNRFLLILTFLASLLAQEGWAELSLTGGFGGSGGTLTKDGQSLTNQGVNYGFQASLNPEVNNKPWPLVLGVQVKQCKLNFVEDGVNKRATYNLYGAHLGTQVILSPTLRFQALAEYYPQADYSVLSTNNVLMNGTSYKYSTWEQYSGSAAMGVRLQFTSDKIDGQFSAHNRFRKGFGLSIVQQSYSRENLQITTSDRQLTPEETYSSADVNYRLLLINIDLSLGLTF